MAEVDVVVVAVDPAKLRRADLIIGGDVVMDPDEPSGIHAADDVDRVVELAEVLLVVVAL